MILFLYGLQIKRNANLKEKWPASSLSASGANEKCQQVELNDA
jgi:hypothetical protein